jgi:hypothetical protein
VAESTPLLDESFDRSHRCSCGATFETVEDLLQHAREEHGAVV